VYASGFAPWNDSTANQTPAASNAGKTAAAADDLNSGFAPWPQRSASTGASDNKASAGTERTSGFRPWGPSR